MVRRPVPGWADRSGQGPCAVSGPRPAPEPDRWSTPEEDGVLDTDCVFHGRVYPEHDFYYGPECRRCGAEADSKDTDSG